MGRTKNSSSARPTAAAAAANSAAKFATTSASDANSATTTSSPAAAPPVPPDIKTAVDKEIMKSFREFNLGNHKQAIKLIDKACLMHKSYPFPHLMRADMYSSAAKLSKDPAEKLHLARVAAASAGWASSLSPSNVFFISIKAFHLYHVATFSMDVGSYDKVLDVCDIALGIPITDLLDPVKDFSIDARIRQFSTCKGRIQHYLQVIHYLRDNAFCAKNRLPDLTAIKSLSQTSEARGKSPASSSFKKTQRGNRHQADETAIAKKSEAVKYLKSLTIEDRLDLHLYSVSILDLLEAAGKRKNLDAILSESLSVIAAGHSIKAFPCCYCRSLTFADAGEHMGHVLEVHVGDLAEWLKDLMPEKSNEELEAVWPENASSDWIQSFVASDWSPLHVQTSQSMDADIAKRAKLLADIRGVFQTLIDQKILSVIHLDYLIRSSKKCILIPPSATQLLDDGVIDLIECIRYLPASNLKTILSFLQGLKNSCRVDEDKAESSAHSNAVQEIHETPWLFLDQSWLILNLVEEDPDALIEWLYDDSRGTDDHRAVWSTTLDKSRVLIEKLQIEFSFLSSLCEEKLIYLDAWSNLRDLTLVENISTEHLKKRRELLLDGSNSVELGAISNLIEYADIDDLEKSIERKARVFQIEICKMDARIMWTKRKLDQLEQKIEQTSVYDYQIALMQFVKPFLQKRLEDLIGKNAMEISDTAAEQLVGEKLEGLYIDKRCDHPKQRKGKPKDRRKKKRT